MRNWTRRQAEMNSHRFDEAVRARYPESAKFFEDPNEFHKGLTDQWNYLDAVQRIPWNDRIPKGSLCLDLGSGVGWLSAYLSTFPNIEKIFALDSSNYFLVSMRPKIESLMNADSGKIEPVESFFSPLFFEDETFDAVIASSSLHHAEHLEEVMKEVHRVLKKDGTFFIVNELPHGNLGYLFVLAKGMLAILARAIFRVYKPTSRAMSSSGILDDPYLGDRRYPVWYWEKAMKRSGFRIVQFIRTGLCPMKSNTRDMRLTHFICKKNTGIPPDKNER
jgi:ubiquinone/menaquinone biosynthesis C-methylase UbiE